MTTLHRLLSASVAAVAAVPVFAGVADALHQIPGARRLAADPARVPADGRAVAGRRHPAVGPQ
jgi:hypothetical protein